LLALILGGSFLSGELGVLDSEDLPTTTKTFDPDKFHLGVLCPERDGVREETKTSLKESSSRVGREVDGEFVGGEEDVERRGKGVLKKGTVSNTSI